MKNIRLIQSAIYAGILLMNMTIAYAENWYANVSGGLGGGPNADETVLNGTIDTEIGYAVMGAVGYRLGDGFSIQGELSWRSNKLEKWNIPNLQGIEVDLDGSLTNLAFMVNGRYEFQENWSLRPFILGGLGFSMVTGEWTGFTIKGSGIGLNVDFDDIDEDDTVFAYQAGGGMAYSFTPQLGVEVSYRFFGTAEPDMGEGLETNNIHHHGLVGLTYAF